MPRELLENAGSELKGLFKMTLSAIRPVLEYAWHPANQNSLVLSAFQERDL